jgi:hypothetical protein
LSRSKLVHDDDVSHSKVTHQQLEIKHFKDTIKERASVESLPSQKIYNEVVNLIKSTGQTMEDIEKLIPIFLKICCSQRRSTSSLSLKN